MKGVGAGEVRWGGVGVKGGYLGAAWGRREGDGIEGGGVNCMHFLHKVLRKRAVQKESF